MSPLLGLPLPVCAALAGETGEAHRPSVLAPENEPVLATPAGASDEHGQAVRWPTFVPIAFRSRVATRGERMSKQELRSPAALSILVATPT